MRAATTYFFCLPPSLPPTSSCYASGREGERVLKLSLQNSFRIQLRLLLPPCQQASLPPSSSSKASNKLSRSWTWDSKGVVEESFPSSNLYSVFSPFSFPCCRDNLSVCFPLETSPPSESCETTLGEKENSKREWEKRTRLRPREIGRFGLWFLLLLLLCPSFLLFRGCCHFPFVSLTAKEFAERERGKKESEKRTPLRVRRNKVRGRRGKNLAD